MKKDRTPLADPLIDEVRERRARLVREHGGLRGWMDHLRKVQREHPEKLVSRGKQAAERGAGRGEAKPG